MSLFPLDRVLTRLVKHGRLTVIGPDGTVQTFGAPDARPAVTVRLRDKSFLWRATVLPALAVGEGYMDGSFSIEEGTLAEFLEVALVSQDFAFAETSGRSFFQRLRGIYHTKDMLNRIGRAEKNVRHHYDIDHALYELFLDKDMQYSCAYWEDGVETLEEAQTAKKRHIARKLRIEPGMEVLDIGSGWGGLAIYLADQFGARVTGVTLSKDQYETSVRRAEEAGLSDRVKFKLLDYRLEDGRYDRIVSVGMFEHIGRPYFKEYFSHLDRLLKPEGVVLLHTIAKMRDPGPSNEWITKYIFPGGYLPTLSELAPIIERQRFWLADLEVLRLHYAETLKAWNERFQVHRAAVAERFDERFCRMWEFYLQGCEASFRFQECCVFQIQLSKKVAAVPITRSYLYADSGRNGAAAAAVESGHREAAE